MKKIGITGASGFLGKHLIKKFIDDFDAVIEAVIVEAVSLAKAAKRNTVMKADMAAAIEKYLKKTDLTWDQTAAQVIKHNPTDLGQISKTIQEWIAAHENPTRKRK